MEIALPRRLLQALAAGAGLVLLLFAGLAFFAHPASDDFCFAAATAKLGFARAQAYWFDGWSGRYAATAAISAAVLPGHLVERYAAWPIATLAATLAAFHALAWSVGQGAIRQPLMLLIAAVLSVLFIALTPEPAQTFYWVTGALTYQLGNVAYVLLVAAVVAIERGLAVTRAGRVAIFVGAAASAVVAIGANEASLLLTLLTLATGTTATLLLRRATSRAWLTLLAIAIIAAALSLAAPGNLARAGSLAGDGMLRPPAWLALAAYLPWALLRLAYWMSNLGVWALAALLWLGTHQRVRSVLYADGRLDRRCLAIPALWIGAMLLLHAMGFVVNRYPLPERAEAVVALVFLLGWCASAVVIAHAVHGDRPPPSPRQATLAAGALLVLALLGSPTIFEGYKDVYRGYRFAKEMRARFALLELHRGDVARDIALASLSRPPRTLFATDIGTDRADPRNVCVAWYFQLRSVTLGPNLPP